jgi:fused signal recognition particle receptor
VPSQKSQDQIVVKAPKIDVSKTEAIEEKATGFFEKIAQAVTTKKLSEDLFEELFFELELALLENNVAVAVIDRIKHDLKEALVNKNIKRSAVLDTISQTLYTTIVDILDVESVDLLANIHAKKPYIISIIGVNGSGKTSTIAKLVHYLKSQNMTCVIGACDTFRAAAIQQLEEHAIKLDTKLIKHDYGADAAAVAFDTVAHAKAKKIDVVLIDTAGRLHSNSNLMAELEKINRVIKPDFTIFIGESITGNDCVEQASKFNSSIGIDGIILTKADIDEKGGAALSVSYVTQKPILFLTTGQRYEDMEAFDKQKILDNLGLQ